MKSPVHVEAVSLLGYYLTQSEGFILGTAVKMFTIAGPVIVYGVSAGMVYGLVLALFNLV